MGLSLQGLHSDDPLPPGGESGSGWWLRERERADSKAEHLQPGSAAGPGRELMPTLGVPASALISSAALGWLQEEPAQVLLELTPRTRKEAQPGPVTRLSRARVFREGARLQVAQGSR